MDDELIEVNKAAVLMRAAMEERDEAIRTAHAAGYSYRDIAEFALVSKARIGVIVRAGGGGGKAEGKHSDVVEALRLLRGLRKEMARDASG